MKSSRSVLITGAAQRLGRRIALSLADEGWNVAIHYRSSAKPAQSLAQEIRGKGRKAWLVKADLHDPQAVAQIIPSLAAQEVKLDCLINCAAVFEKDTLATLTAESFEAHMRVNLLAPLQLMRDFEKHYKGRDGNIINITDGLNGWSMSEGFLTYTLSKQGLGYASAMLALKLAPRIRVNVVAPGPTLEGKQDKKDTFDKLKKMIPLARVSSPLEVCDAIHYLLSAPSLTGQTLSLSGGLKTSY